MIVRRAQKQLARPAREQIISSLPNNRTSCTAQTARCHDARNYGAELRPCCRQHIRQIVADCLDIFARRGVTVWADYGTLLGAVRNPLTTWSDYPWLPQAGRADKHLEPGILPHDKDADFGLYGLSYPVLWTAGVLSKLKQKYQVIARPQGRSLKVRLSSTNHSNVDFFLWLDKPTGGYRRVNYLSVDRYKGRDIPAGRLFPLTTVEWEGMRLPAPRDPEWFCEFRYGPNWRTPIPANNDGMQRG